MRCDNHFTTPVNIETLVFPTFLLWLQLYADVHVTTLHLQHMCIYDTILGTSSLNQYDLY